MMCAPDLAFSRDKAAGAGKPDPGQAQSKTRAIGERARQAHGPIAGQRRQSAARPGGNGPQSGAVVRWKSRHKAGQGGDAPPRRICFDLEPAVPHDRLF